MCKVTILQHKIVENNFASLFNPIHVHCTKYHLNIGIKTESVAVGAEEMVHVWFLGQIFVHK